LVNPQLTRRRRGAVAVLMAMLLIPMLAMVSLCVDYGYLLVVKTELQRAADMAALAAVRDLIPAPDGTQDLDVVCDSVRQYVTANVPGGLTVLDADIEIGRFDPGTIYSDVTLLDDGIQDAVRVTLRRDSTANSPVSLFFSRIIGISQADIVVTATAVLQKATDLPPGSDILPIAIPQSTWDAQSPGETWNVYGDGKVEDSQGNTVPGNWGTVDIGESSNSTNDLNEQIDNGLRQSDLEALFSQGRIASSDEIGVTEQFWANADTGLSSGMKHSIQDNHGKTKLVPIVSENNGKSGNNLEYHVVGWGVVKLEDSNWSGSKNTYVLLTKAYMYDQDLGPSQDLSETANVIEGAYTSPALVE
jgi:hypothetical protein